MDWKRWLGLAAVPGILAGISCSGEAPSPPTDLIPPAAVTDLTLVSASADTLVLVWTAPGDDGWSGTAEGYDLRCAASGLCEETWSTALRPGEMPRPHPAGTTETTTLRGLPTGVRLQIALRVADEAGNWSDLSNLVEAVVPEAVRLRLDPSAAEVPVGGTRRWSVAVTGTANPAVAWSVDEGPAHGTVAADGLYRAPAIVPSPPTATLRATCVADPAVSATATVTIVPPAPPPPGFVMLPAGEFVMGDGEAWCGVLEHPVRLTEAFLLGETEVTNAQFLEMVQWAWDRGHVTATGASVRDALDGSAVELLDLDSGSCEIGFRDGVFVLVDAGHGAGNGDHPVKWVSWYGAAAYCDWLSLREGLSRAYDHTTWVCGGGDPYRARSYRLPTNAEWEYAAQFDDERIYPWGDEPPTCARANFHGCNAGWTEPVATRAAGAEKIVAGRGLYDMAGNVWEWCNDWWECESVPDAVDPAGPPAGIHKMYRGGAWSSGPIIVLRCAARDDRGVPRGAASIIGFRVARTVAP